MRPRNQMLSTSTKRIDDVDNFLFTARESDNDSAMSEGKTGHRSKGEEL